MSHAIATRRGASLAAHSPFHGRFGCRTSSPAAHSSSGCMRQT